MFRLTYALQFYVPYSTLNLPSSIFVHWAVTAHNLMADNFIVL
jgi:hypothetical protein